VASRKRIELVVAMGLSLGLMGGVAQALPTISMIWEDNWSSVLEGATPSSERVAQIVLEVDPDPGVFVIGVFITIEYDPTELVGLEAREHRSVNLPGMFNHFTPVGLHRLSDATPNGVVHDAENAMFLAFDQIALGKGFNAVSPGSSRTLGSVKFRVRSPSGGPSDIDVVASLRHSGIDGISTFSDAGYQTGTANFVGASLVPEARLAPLLVAGFLSLVWAARPRRASGAAARR